MTRAANPLEKTMNRTATLLLLAAALSALGSPGCKDAPAPPSSVPAPRSTEDTTSPPLPAAARVGDPADWCGGHALPESMCTKCNPELVARFEAAGDWCAEHGFPESACPFCNPMTPPGEGHADDHDHGHARRVGDPVDWCTGHGLPESMCTKCNPELVARFKAAGDWCAEHGFPDSACPFCNPMTPPGEGHADEHGHGHTARVGDPADWCGGHALPESMCTKCNPELVARFEAAGDWCAEHGFPESACPFCNPMTPPGEGHADEHGHDHTARVGDPADWCGGHGLPESMCTKCNPELVPRFEAAGDWCAEHGFPESACPFCNPRVPPPGYEPPSAIAPGTVVRFATPELERAAGIETVPATAGALGAAIEAPARIDFDRNAFAEVRSAVPGIVREVAVDLGQTVAVGERLFVLESARVGDLQARRGAVRERIAAARADLARQRELRAANIASERQVDVAERELEAARAELRSLEQSLRISGAPSGGSAGRFDVTAPIAGTVVRRPGVIGASAGASEPLAAIADTTTMWALLDVSEWEASAVRVGQPVDVTVGGAAGHHFTGRVTWVAAEVDPRTRTVTARASLDNRDGLLRAGQFARGAIRTDAPGSGTAVPLAAVQRVGEESVVFVRRAAGEYEPRVVRVGRTDSRRALVSGDLRPGDAVVTTGAYLLRTELSRDSIGAGCCETDAPGGE